MQQESSFAETFAPAPTYTTPKKRGKRFLVMVILVILLLGGGYVVASRFLGFNFVGQSQNETPSPTPTEFLLPTDTPFPTEQTTTPEVSTTPTPAPTANPVDKTTGLDRSDLSIQVQNGSGQVGVANKGSDYLKKIGYKVVSIGNAASYNYEGISVLVKSTSSKYLTLLKADLAKQYTVSSSSADLSASSSADALVIIGK